MHNIKIIHQLKDYILTNIDYEYIHFRFYWSWIKDKQIIHKGNQYYGVLMIVDENGIAIKTYGYELIN
jgi:hypothetical protein